jgi:hypothetical protein
MTPATGVVAAATGISDGIDPRTLQSVESGTRDVSAATFASGTLSETPGLFVSGSGRAEQQPGIDIVARLRCRR